MGKACKRGHPLVEENIIRVGPKQHRRCRTCQIAKKAEQRLRELRWLNGPRVLVSAVPARDIWGPRVLPWSKLDAIEHGTRRRRFNPWVRSFESLFTPPALWQEIFAQVRPTPAEMKAKAAHDQAADWYESVGRVKRGRQKRAA